MDCESSNRFLHSIDPNNYAGALRADYTLTHSCNGATIWRGHFDDFCSSDPFQLKFMDQYEHSPGLTLAISGGDSFAASVWINGVFINTTVAKSSTTTVSAENQSKENAMENSS